MTEFEVLLDTCDKAKKFANSALKCEDTVTAKSKLNNILYVVDGKSLLGLFSLDLSKPVTIECSNALDRDKLKKAVD